MIAALLLMAAEPPDPAPPPSNAIEAERAFAADAQRLGQWTAFRKWSGFGAVMFVPEVVNAWQWLRDKKDPPQSVRWQLAQSFQSCDGLTAINVGPWQRPDGSFGYFTTIWFYETELVAGPRWVWAYDAGDTLKKPMAEPPDPIVRRASCENIPKQSDDPSRYAIPSAPSPDSPEAQSAKLHSRDKSIRYDYKVGANQERHFVAWLWNGTMYEKILDQVAAPPQ